MGSSADVTNICFAKEDKLVGASDYMVWSSLLRHILKEKGLSELVEPIIVQAINTGPRAEATSSSGGASSWGATSSTSTGSGLPSSTSGAGADAALYSTLYSTRQRPCYHHHLQDSIVLHHTHDDAISNRAWTALECSQAKVWIGFYHMKTGCEKIVLGPQDDQRNLHSGLSSFNQTSRDWAWMCRQVCPWSRIDSDCTLQLTWLLV